MFSTQTLIAMAVFAVVWIFIIRRTIRQSKAIREGKYTPPPIRPLNPELDRYFRRGTTTMEPGDLTRIEEGLRSAGKSSEE